MPRLPFRDTQPVAARQDRDSRRQAGTHWQTQASPGGAAALQREGPTRTRVVLTRDSEMADSDGKVVLVSRRFSEKC